MLQNTFYRGDELIYAFNILAFKAVCSYSDIFALSEEHAMRGRGGVIFKTLVFNYFIKKSLCRYSEMSNILFISLTE